MELRLYRSNFVKHSDGHERGWNRILKQLGVKSKERSGVYEVILDVRKANIPNATGSLFDFD